MFFRSQACLSALSIFFSFAMQCAPANAVELNSDSIAPLFKKYTTGCFELLDCSTGKRFRYNAELCGKRLPPQSTFKIFNSMVGLETGVLKDENHLMKWDGKKHEMASWNQDQTLASAVKNSCVWYFQNVAALVGEEKMKKYVQEAHYGNEDMSAGITEFWLSSSMKISPDEQADFMKNWYLESLPFSKRSMEITKKITEIEKTDKGELHGKTGTDGAKGKNFMGWFVGYVVHDGHAYAFATNVQAPNDAYGSKARDITKTILKENGLL